MASRILVVAANLTRARAIADTCRFVGRPVDVATPRKPPKNPESCKLLIWEGSARLKKPGELLDRLPKSAHVVMLVPNLDVRWVSYYMDDPRANHFIAVPADLTDLRSVVEKLASGAIFGLDRYLPPQVSLQYRRVSTFKQRCDVLDEIDELATKARLRGQYRRAAGRVAEELLMNAMYQAPVDGAGERVFRDVDPSVRIRRKTPRPVSVRFAVAKQSFYLCVRDRFGSFHRDDLARYLLRCVTDAAPIEQKKLGAGLGLFQVASSVSRLVINVLPGSVAEFICMLEPRASSEPRLRMLSVTTARPAFES